MTADEARVDAQLNELGLDERLSAPSDRHRHPVWRAFEARGWTVSLDAEGDFMNEGEHSKLVLELLRLADAAPRVRDRWLDGRGWLLEVRGDHRTLMCLLERDTDPSDYFERALIVPAVRAWLGDGWTLLSKTPVDQTVDLAVVPSRAYDALKRARVSIGHEKDLLSSYETEVVAPAAMLALVDGFEAPKGAELLVTRERPAPPRAPYVCEPCAKITEVEAALEGGDAAGALARCPDAIGDLHLYRAEDGHMFLLNEADLRLRICRARALIALDRHDEAEREANLALRELNRRSVRRLDAHLGWWVDVVEVLTAILARREGIHPTLARFRACEAAEAVPAARAAR